MNPLCLDQGVGLIPWSPLGRGSTDPARPVIAAVEAVASARELPMAQIALAWLLDRPGVTAPIVGANPPIANPIWVPIAIPDNRTLVVNISP